MQVVSVLLPRLTQGPWQSQQAGLMALRTLATQGCSLRPWLPALVPGLLDLACHAHPEVSALLLQALHIHWQLF